MAKTKKRNTQKKVFVNLIVFIFVSGTLINYMNAEISNIQNNAQSSSSNSNKNCKYDYSTKEYVCSYDIGFSVQKEPEIILAGNLFENIGKNNSDNFIKNSAGSKLLQILVGTEGNISFYLENKKSNTVEMEYYGYIYSGSKCISCNATREENLKRIVLLPNSRREINIAVIPKQSGNYSYKIKYKEIQLKTWKELNGNVSVLEERDHNNSYLGNSENGSSINNNSNNINIDINSNNNASNASKKINQSSLIKKTSSNADEDEEIREGTINSTTLNYLKNRAPEYLGISGEKIIAGTGESKGTRVNGSNDEPYYISKTKFLGNFIFILIACGAIILSFFAILKS